MEQLVIHLVNLRFTIGLLWLGEISTFSSAKSFTVFTWTATVKPWALKTKNKKKGLKRLKCSIIWGKWRGCYIFCRFSQSLIPLTHTHSIIIHPTATAWKTTSPQSVQVSLLLPKLIPLMTDRLSGVSCGVWIQDIDVGSFQYSCSCFASRPCSAGSLCDAWFATVFIPLVHVERASR